MKPSAEELEHLLTEALAAQQRSTEERIVWATQMSEYKTRLDAAEATAAGMREMRSADADYILALSRTIGALPPSKFKELNDYLWSLDPKLNLREFEEVVTLFADQRRLRKLEPLARAAVKADHAQGGGGFSARYRALQALEAALDEETT